MVVISEARRDHDVGVPLSPVLEESVALQGPHPPGGGQVLGAHAAEPAGRVLLFTFFEELADPMKKLVQIAWAGRGKLGRDVKAYTLLLTGLVCSMPGRASKVINNPRLHELIKEEEDPQALAAVICGLSGALCLGSTGGVVGATIGGATGLALGAAPAIFTFGLSLPAGAIIGSTAGLFTGSAVGASAGVAAGATSGMTVAYFRNDIKHTTLYIAARVYDVYDVLVVRPVTAVRKTGRRLTDSVHSGADYTVSKAKAVGAVAQDFAADNRVRASAAGAGAGACALGTAGAASGALLGGAAGAIVGLVPAVFTFGLSIPVCAFVGGSAGLCTGGAAGTTVGFTGGGLAGCVGYTYRKAPAAVYSYATGKARAAASAVRFRSSRGASK